MRDTDRWITPRVVVVLILAALVVVLAALASVTYLAARGIDPAPTLKLVAQLGGGLSGVLSLLLQLATRRTVTKTERNTAPLYKAEHVTIAARPAVPQPARHAYSE